MKGYFGIGVEGLSKQQNLGALMRTAHAFGAQFLFTVGANYSRRLGGKTDTSSAVDALPLYAFDGIEDMRLPDACQMVGIELTDDAIELPSFRHPPRAAYILGPERSSLSPAMTERCAYVVKIPTRFCVNVGLAGALVMYDRMISLGRFAERPVRVGAPTAEVAQHVHGGPRLRHLERAAKGED